MSTGSVTMTATGNSSAVDKNPQENYETITVLPTAGATPYATMTFTVEGSVDGTNFEQVLVLDTKTGLTIAGGTSIAPSDGTARTYAMMFANNYTKFRVNVGAIASGSATFLFNGSTTPPGPALFNSVAGGAGSFTNVTASGTLAVTGATTLSSTLAAGNTSITGTLAVSSTANVVGNFTVATNKLVVTAASGNVASAGSILSTSGTGGIGYATGAGGTVTQGTNRTTGVTINKVTGAITLVSAAGSTTPATFTVTNSTVAATDTVLVSQKSGTDLYDISVSRVAAGEFDITFSTKSGTTTEQPVFNFVVLKGVTS